MLRTEWIKPGALVMPHGTASALKLLLTDIMAKLVVDDRGQVGAGPYGALRQHVNAGKLTRRTPYAEMGGIAAGLKPGREGNEETVLFWHPGLSRCPTARRATRCWRRSAASASGNDCVSGEARREPGRIKVRKGWSLLRTEAQRRPSIWGYLSSIPHAGLRKNSAA